VAEVEGTWDLVLANLFAETLVELATPLVARTGRVLVLAGILADREARVRDAFDARLGPPERLQDGEWVCLVYRRDVA
jgi:ribosomal protein L11 methyltransferase